jgi:hypothetical protein
VLYACKGAHTLFTSQRERCRIWLLNLLLKMAE